MSDFVAGIMIMLRDAATDFVACVVLWTLEGSWLDSGGGEEHVRFASGGFDDIYYWATLVFTLRNSTCAKKVA